MDDLESQLKSIGKDVLISLIIILFILGILFIYSGRWPPLVVIESSSMSHGIGNPPDSKLGVIDTGDIVIVKESDNDDIITYVEGKGNGHRTYGQSGDVIIYKALGKEETPIIHRAVLYLEYDNGAFDIPSLKNLDHGEEWSVQGFEVNQGMLWDDLKGTLYLHDYGYADKDIKIDLDHLLIYEHSGYITLGDHNPRIDQNRGDPICAEPVKEQWIEGKARGELPWFGIIKLSVIGKTTYIPQNSWYYLSGSIVFIVFAPFLVEYSYETYQKKWKEIDGEENTGNKEDDHPYEVPKGEQGEKIKEKES